MRAAAGCCCNGSMNDTTYAYDAGGAAGPGTNGSDSYGSNPYGSPAPGPQPKPKRQSDRFFSWIRGSAMERGDDRWIAGVCSAIAQRVGWSPTLVRALVLASVVLCGFGLALYAIAWALLPDARDGRILGEELIDGRWDWNMLGVIIMMMLAVAVPGAGLAAALCAARLCPNALGYLVGTHASSEPASRELLRELGIKAPLDAGMHLGEGAGAMAYLPLLDSALRVYRDGKTFTATGMAAYEHFEAGK